VELNSGSRTNQASSAAKTLTAARFGLEELDASTDICFLVNAEGTILYCNRAWDGFALANGGENLLHENMIGKTSFDSLPEELSDFYRKQYRWVIENNKTWEHDYECSSAKTFRRFHMRVLPIGDFHLLIENSLLVERPHRRKRHPADRKYINEQGFVIMCAHCRRTQYMNPQSRCEWHWVPSYLMSASARVSHGLCQPYISFHYKMAIKDLLDGQSP
jgi:hypothetical protein